MSCVGLWSSPWSVVISWLVVYGHGLGGSVVIFCACGSFPGSCSVVMSWVGLWSSSGSVVIIWIVVYGHVLGVSVVMSGLWSSSVSVVIIWIVGCGHVLGGSVFMSCVDTGCESGIASG